MSVAADMQAKNADARATALHHSPHGGDNEVNTTPTEPNYTSREHWARENIVSIAEMACSR